MKQLHIGKVSVSEAILQEMEETEDFQSFCMGCVRRHRIGDWGDIPKEQWIRNNLAARKGGEIVSEYLIPGFFCIGYADRILVIMDEDRSETPVIFPDDE